MAYADTTKVPVSQSQDSVKRLLKGAGADTIAVYESADKSAVAFRIAGRYYRITVPVPSGRKGQDQEERRSWRLILLLVKAKMEAVKEGVTTIEREFLADMMMPDGSTVYEWTERPVALAYSEGKMPDQLLLPGARP